MSSHDPLAMLRKSTTEVHLFGKQGCWPEAIHVLRICDEAAMEPDLQLLSSVVGACAKPPNGKSRWIFWT